VAKGTGQAKGNSRPSPLPLLSKALNRLQHLLPPTTSIHQLAAHTHADLLPGIRTQQPLQQQMPHLDTNVYPAIAAILLLRAIIQIHEPERSVQQRRDLVCGEARLVVV